MTDLTAKDEAWLFMWSLAFGIYFLAKVATLAVPPRPRGFRLIGYLAGWPGMNPTPFRGSKPMDRPKLQEWLFASSKFLLGITLVWGLARLAPWPILAGWIGMIGFVFVLHFGLFHLSALGWRTLGVNATPIMNWPIAATSLAEFWGQRWNLAFRDLANRFVFRPMCRHIGPGPAMLAVFAVSGVIHEIIISWPAGGGWGLPLGYFFFQGLGIAAQHHWPTLRGRAFTLGLVAGPACLLFHPPFVSQVFLPFLKAIYALP